MVRVKIHENFLYPETQVDYHCYNAEYPIMHDHEYWEFTVVTEGKIRHIINNTETLAEKGDLLFLRPADKHCFHYYQNYTTQQFNFMISDSEFRKVCSSLDIHNSPINSLYNKLKKYPRNIQCRLSDARMKEMSDTVDNLRRLKAREIFERTLLIKLAYTGALQAVCRQLLFSRSDYPEWLNDFLDKLAQPENFGLKVEELCKFTHFSQSHLNKLFKSLTGSTVIESFTRARLAYAANLLETTSLTVLAIASHAGYDSISRFHKNFLDTYHSSPGNYRKQIKLARLQKRPHVPN